MIKSPEEIDVIRNGARIADLGGEAAVAAIADGVAEYEVALAGTRAMASCGDIARQLNRVYQRHGVLERRTFGYGHSFGVLSHHYGREAGLELREDIETVLEPNMVVSMEPMITIPHGQPGAGGYREHDILVVGGVGWADVVATTCSSITTHSVVTASPHHSYISARLWAR